MKKYLAIVSVFVVMCRQQTGNNPPTAPIVPFGADTGYLNVAYTFTSSAIDPDDDSIMIRFDWGDGDTSEWSHRIISGDTISMQHLYSNAGIYHIKAQAKDIYGALSGWSKAHKIVIIATWEKLFGGIDDERGIFVKQTDDGGYIVVGYTFSYGGGGQDLLLIKIDATGNIEWYKTFGGIQWDCGFSLCLTDDGGFALVGYTESYGAGDKDIWLIKTDANGNEEWNKTFGDTAKDYGNSICKTSDGGFIITGYTTSYGAGGKDVWLIKTDANGNKEWDKTFGGINDDWGKWVCQTQDGGYLIVGATYSYVEEIRMYGL